MALFLLIHLHYIFVTWSCLFFCPIFYPAIGIVCCLPTSSFTTSSASIHFYSSLAACFLSLAACSQPIKDFLLHLLKSHPLTLFQAFFLKQTNKQLPISHIWAHLLVPLANFSLGPLCHLYCTPLHHLIFSCVTLTYFKVLPLPENIASGITPACIYCLFLQPYLHPSPILFYFLHHWSEPFLLTVMPVCTYSRCQTGCCFFCNVHFLTLLSKFLHLLLLSPLEVVSSLLPCPAISASAAVSLWSVLFHHHIPDFAP